MMGNFYYIIKKCNYEQYVLHHHIRRGSMTSWRNQSEWEMGLGLEFDSSSIINSAAGLVSLPVHTFDS